MKIAVFGAGAIGCFVAGMMARAGFAPTLIARGPMLKAINANGLTVNFEGADFTVPLFATEDTAAAGPQDLVILTTKAHQIVGALPAIAPLIGPNTLVMPAINGIPWWYCKGLSGPQTQAIAGRDLASCDPSGRIDRLIPVDQVLGAVVYLAASIPEPGRVDTVGPKTLVIGDAGGANAAMAREVSQMLSQSGFDAPVVDDIRAAVWTKLWGNVHSNPLSVATMGTMTQICTDPKVSDVSRRIMQETEAVANAVGVTFPMTIEDRLVEGAKLGAFRTSMLQDFDKGRPIELDAILGVVSEIGSHMGIETPAIDMLYAIVKMRANVAGCYEPPA